MSLHDVLLEELRDLYSAENQLVKALPKVKKAAASPELKEAIGHHLEQTKGQVERLRQIFSELGKKPTGQHCNGMEGVIKEGTEAVESEEEGAVKDIELIGASLRVEHYEVAGYTAAIAIAKALGHTSWVSLLNETLSEEKDTAKLLVTQAKPLLKAAASEVDADEEEEDKEPEDSEDKESDKKSQEDEEEAKTDMKTKR